MTTSPDSPRHGVILFAHGSRDPLWRRPMEAVAERVAARRPGAPVRCAYLELTEPSLDAVAAEFAAQGLAAATIVPMFLGAGRHVREDLPEILRQLRERHPATEWRLQPPVGEDDRLLDLLAQLALDAAR